jgi:WD40 repeat protein
MLSRIVVLVVFLAVSAVVHSIEFPTVRNGRELPDSEPCPGMAFSPDGSLLAYFHSVDGQVDDAVVWDVHAGKEVTRFKKAGRGMHAFSADGKHLVSGLESGAIHRYSTKSWELTGTLSVGPKLWGRPFSNFVALSPDGRLVAFATPKEPGDGKEKGSVVVWDFETKSQVALFFGHRETALGAAFSPNGKLLATVGGMDPRYLKHGPPPGPGEVNVWDLATGKAIFTNAKASSCLLQVAFAPDSKRIIATGKAGNVVLCDLAGDKESFLKYPVKQPVHAAQFSPSGKVIVTVGWAAVIQLWDSTTGELQGTVGTNLRLASTGMISPNARQLLLTVPGGIHLWDLRVE